VIFVVVSENHKLLNSNDDLKNL